MSTRDEDTEEPRQLGPRAARKAAQEAARAALEARVDAAPVDVGQFDGLTEPSNGARARYATPRRPAPAPVLSLHEPQEEREHEPR